LLHVPVSLRRNLSLDLVHSSVLYCEAPSSPASPGLPPPNPSFVPPPQGTLPIQTPIASTVSSLFLLPTLSHNTHDVDTPFSCEWMDCTENIDARHSPFLVRRLRVHFEEFHPDALDTSLAQKLCRWRGCVCRISRYERCKDQSLQHSAHVQDMFTHVRRVHVKEFPPRSS
jgi:hypothetical protein